MTFRAVAMMIAVLFLGGITFDGLLPDHHATMAETRIASLSPALASETSGLSGVWEGVWDGQIPSRMVVEQQHPEWATVLLAWGEGKKGSVTPGSMRLRAKVLPDGRIHVDHPVHLTLTLSEDRMNLVGTKGPSDSTVSLLLGRIRPTDALAPLAVP
ncbi:MAG: hypothetical protein HY712_06680 [candidate division NC10 bacterium]|nr:hypothetical protein [candidate division NC10 bacterium]